MRDLYCLYLFAHQYTVQGMAISVVNKGPPTEYYSIIKRKRFYSHLRNPLSQQQHMTIGHQPIDYKCMQFSKINIYDQSQPDRNRMKVLVLEPRICLSHRFREGHQSLRINTEKVEKDHSVEPESKSTKKVLYLRKKHNKGLLNRLCKTEKVSELNITRKKLDSRPLTAHTANYWTLPEKPSKKKPGLPNSPRLKKKNSILSPW